MRIVFMGTPDFAVPCLQSLIDNGYDVVAVFTQPDKPKGRKMVLTPPPVKELAVERGIPVYQPQKLSNTENVDLLNELQPDCIVVVAYGQLLPENILSIPTYGCINVHGSLLPEYRGAAPIQWSVIDGKKVTGVTTMYMDKGLDTGDILLQSTTEIDENETAGELFDRLSVMGGKLIVETLIKAEKNELIPVKQNDAEATYSKKLDKSISIIDFNNKAQSVHDFVRGMNPWPVAYTKLNGKTLKIFKTQICSIKGDCGKVLSISPFVVGCGDNSVEILEVQLEGKKRMDIKSFLSGHKIEIGTLLGE